MQPFPNGLQSMCFTWATAICDGCPARVRTKFGDDWVLQRPERTWTGGLASPGKARAMALCRVRTISAAWGWAPAVADGGRIMVYSVDWRILGTDDVFGDVEGDTGFAARAKYASMRPSLVAACTRTEVSNQSLKAATIAAFVMAWSCSLERPAAAWAGVGGRGFGLDCFGPLLVTTSAHQTLSHTTTISWLSLAPFSCCWPSTISNTLSNLTTLSSPKQIRLSSTPPSPSPKMAHIFNDPIDIEPLPVEGTQIVSSTNAPPPHDIRLDRQIQETDFNDTDNGMQNLAAVKHIRALLQRGFETPDNPDSGVPRGTWLVIVAELLVAIHKSIRASHGANPSPRAFQDLDQEELALFNIVTKVSDTYDFFEGYKDNTEEWSTCLRCLEQCRRPLDEATYNSVAMTCGQSINAIHVTVVNEKTWEIYQRVHDWGENLFTTITNTFTDQLTADSFDATSLIAMDDPHLSNWLNVTAHNLREHARSKLLDEAVDKYVIPWASERMDAATGSILATDNDRIRDLRADTEKRANTDANKYYTDLLPTLREEALACAKADTYASFMEDQAHFRAKADAELASFKHSLRIETADRKAKAQEAADKSVLSLARSSAKANKGKAQHNPMGKRSRAPSVSGSRPPSVSFLSYVSRFEHVIWRSFKALFKISTVP